jgi:hypothetical protein
LRWWRISWTGIGFHVRRHVREEFSKHGRVLPATATNEVAQIIGRSETGVFL